MSVDDHPGALRPNDDPIAPRTGPVGPTPTATGWRDELVELHVLAEHGDTDAAASAAAWLARDTSASQAWYTVEQACQLVRGEPRLTSG